MQKQLKTLAALCLVFVSAGCDALFEDAGQRQPVAPPGIATPDDVDAVSDVATPAAQSEAPPQQQAEPPQPPANAGNQSGSIVGQTTDQILDIKQALARNPNLEVTDNKVSGNDPLSQAGSVYNRASAVAGSAGIVQWIQHYEIQNTRYPTHAEVVGYMQQHNVRLPVLAGKQQWGYNSDTGAIVTVRQR